MNRPAGSPTDRHADRAARRVALAFLVALASAVGLAAVYWQGGQPQLEGVLLAGTLGGLGAGSVIWGKRLMPQEPIVEEREPLASSADDREAVAAELGDEAVRRRRVLRWLLGGALGATVAAFLFPVRSLGPRPGGALFHTPWAPGRRAVDPDGRPVRADDLDVGGVVTVFPEGHTDAADAQALLIRVQPQVLEGATAASAARGLVAYSKLCTHLACPVALYQQESHLLLCPCHQSTFDVLDRARPTFGPAARRLPQLPIDVDDAGFVVARGDFDGAVAAGFWYRPE